MERSLSLLSAIGKAALRHLPATGAFPAEALPELAADAWGEWHPNRDTEQRRADLAAVAQATPGECQRHIETVVLDLAAERPVAQREALALYLSLVPGQVRQSLRRPSDPLGATVPRERVPGKADDLLGLLPARLPRFRPGDRPLAGVDWQLDELLGIGGFGEVWKARHAFFDGIAPVALKFCLDPTAAGYLRNEAAVLHRVMSQGRHPGIIPLQHTYLSAETPCLEYELVTGGDLAGLIQEWHQGGQRPDPVLVCRTMHELASIVGHAHAQAPPIVHRDLKPANVLRQIAPDGGAQLKVADFGIGGIATRQALAQQTRGTSPGLFLATALRGSCTPLYASPQQMRGEAPDVRDDVYSLGVIWYQMLTGDLTSGCPGGTRWQRRLEEMGLERRLVELLGECLEDHLDDRLADANLLAHRLADLLPALPAVARPAVAPEPTRAAPSAALAQKQLSQQESLRGELMALSALLRRQPDDAAALARRGETYRQLRQIDEAIADCTEAIRHDARQAAAYATRAAAHRMRNDLAMALADCDVALELDATCALAWATRGEAHRLRGEIDRAIHDCTEALRLDAAHVGALGTRGAARARQRDFAGALADLDELLRLDPTNAWALVVRGDVHREQGDLARAIADCNEAIRLQPENSFAYTTRGLTFRQKGDFGTAIADLERALRLRPDNQFARDQLALARKRQR